MRFSFRHCCYRVSSHLAVVEACALRHRLARPLRFQAACVQDVAGRRNTCRAESQVPSTIY